MTEQDFRRVPIADLQNPRKRGLMTAIADHWWIVDDGGNALFYQRRPFRGFESPQCHRDRRTIEHVMSARTVGRGTLTFVPWAWVPQVRE